MRDTLFKYLPLVFGGVLGWMLFHPPAWLESLGALSWLINAGLVALVFVAAMPLFIIANLPRDVRMDPAPDSSIHTDMHALGARLEQLGFERNGGPIRVNVAPAATMLGYVHSSHPVYASVFRTDTVPAQTGHDFVSILHGERGTLTTNADPSGAALPGGDGGLRQVLPGESVEGLFRAHLEGLEYLTRRGISLRAVSAGTFQRDFCESMSRQRRVFLSSPFVGTLVTVWRATTKKVPFVGKLAEQAIASRQIERLSTGTART